MKRSELIVGQLYVPKNYGNQYVYEAIKCRNTKALKMVKSPYPNQIGILYKLPQQLYAHWYNSLMLLEDYIAWKRFLSIKLKEQFNLEINKIFL